jgi:hypothetical protein
MGIIQEPLETNLSFHTINDLIVAIYHMADKAETHPAFQGDVPEYVSRAPKLRQIAAGLEQARDAAAGHDQYMMAEKKRLVAAALLAVSMNGQHIVMFSMCRNDPSLLLNAGYESKKTIVKAPAVNLLDLVPELFVKHTLNVTGGISVIMKRAKQNAATELMITDQDPNIEASWVNSLGIFHKSRIELKGQKPASTIYLKGRYHEDGATGRWSQVVSIIVL